MKPQTKPFVLSTVLKWSLCSGLTRISVAMSATFSTISFAESNSRMLASSRLTYENLPSGVVRNTPMGAISTVGYQSQIARTASVRSGLLALASVGAVDLSDILRLLVVRHYWNDGYRRWSLMR